MSRDHLAPTAAALLDCSKAERLEAIHEDRWITYPRARFALEVLETLLARPRTTRMTSVAVYADSGMGKTMLMERFKRAHPPAYDPNERRMVAPVLALQMASHATERRFYGQLLTSIGVPFAPRATVLDLEFQALRNLRRMDVKVLMLDEVHNILAGNAREQRIVPNMLRYLSNELKISLVCLGVSEVREAIGGDVQLARRFEELILPRWQGTRSSKTSSWPSCGTFRSGWPAKSRLGLCGRCCRRSTVSRRACSGCSTTSPPTRSRAVPSASPTRASRHGTR